MKPQLKTKKLLNLISTLKSSLKENNDIELRIYTDKDILTINYEICVRRDRPCNVIIRFQKDLNKFIKICKDSKIVSIEKADFVKFNEKFKKYGNEAYTGYSDEYSEYEICIVRTFKFKLGKNQNLFFNNK